MATLILLSGSQPSPSHYHFLWTMFRSVSLPSSFSRRRRLRRWSDRCLIYRHDGARAFNLNDHTDRPVPSPLSQTPRKPTANGASPTCLLSSQPGAVGRGSEAGSFHGFPVRVRHFAGKTFCPQLCFWMLILSMLVLLKLSVSLGMFFPRTM